MHRVLAAAGLSVERGNAPGLLVDRIGADLVEVGMDRIEKALRRVERQEGGVGDFEELFVTPGARGWVHPVDVDAAAMAFALRGRECADIGEQRRRAAASRLRFGMPSPQYRRACRGHGGGLKHDTPVDAPVCDGWCFSQFALHVASKPRFSVK